MLALQLLHTAAGSPIRDGGIDPANLGRGDWLYQLDDAVNKCNGNVPAVTDVPSLMVYLKNQGLRYVIVKAGTGTNLFSTTGFSPQFTSSLVGAAHDAGLWIFGYSRSYATNTTGEAGIADYVFQQGADGFVWDVEGEWEDTVIGTQGPALATGQCSLVRSNWPNKFLAYSTFPIIHYHPSVPYQEFGYYCDAVMPQDYWNDGSLGTYVNYSPTTMVQDMSTEYRNWQNGLTGIWVNAIKPIVPTGQGWNADRVTTGAQITEFVNALKSDPNPATAGGYQGVNYWVCELHPPDVWSGIAANNIGNFPTNVAPVIANVDDSNETASAATITWTTDQSSDSVVEYGLDTSYGFSVTNSAPSYYHSIVLGGLSAYTTYYYRIKSRNANGNTAVSGANVFATLAVTVTDVIVESRSGGQNYAAYSDVGVYPNSWNNSSAKSTAYGCTSGIGSRYNSATGVGGAAVYFQVNPTLAVPGGQYEVDITFGTSNPAAGATSTISGTGWTGLPQTVAISGTANAWKVVGTLTLNAGVTSPTVRFDETANTGNFLADAVKFHYVPPAATGPVIITQPPSAQTNVQGSTATFSVVASGSPPLYYHWRFNGAVLSDAILRTYSKNDVQPGDAGTYSVVISNSVNSVTSRADVLTVVLPAGISVQPADTVVLAGANAGFSVTATGDPPLSYQWQWNGTNLAGATRSGLTITNAQVANAGAYGVVVTNQYGSVLSAIASLVVQDPFILAQPQNQSVAAGATASFTVSAGGTLPLSYQWRKDGQALADGAGLGGAHTASLTVTNVQSGSMGNYSVVISNLNGWVASSNATLTGPFAPTIFAQPASQKVPAGSVPVLTVGALGAGLSFQWTREGTNLADGGKISGTTTASLVVSNLEAGEVGNYAVVVTNVYGRVTSSNALLSEWPLAAWGYDNFAQTDIPGGLTNPVGVAAGYYHSLAVNADGTVAAWGAGKSYLGSSPYYGQCAVPAGLTNAVAVAAGGYHSLALKGDGTVVAWGAGTNYTGTSPSYGQAIVPGGLTKVAAIAAGYYHSLALNQDGTVVAWGAGTNSGTGINYGQAAVPAGLTNAVAVAAGNYHCLALRAGGTLVGWGAGTSNTGISPQFGQAMIPGNLSNVVAVAAGAFHSLALKQDGTVVAWGLDGSGQSDVPPGLNNVVAVAAGGNSCLALKADGTLVGWGDKTYGQTNIPPGITSAVAISVGGYHTLALQNTLRPALILQPAAQVAIAGQTVNLSVMAIGSQPLSYQWLHGGTNLAGATGATLVLPGVQRSDAGSYAAIVTNPVGAVTSSNALLTVLSPPSITVQPQGLSINQGSNATFSVTAAGDAPLAYQWTFNGTNLPGATASTFTRANAQAGDAGSYAVVVTNAVGSVTSSNAVLGFNVPPAITAQPQSLAAATGSKVVFSVTATGTAPLSYQWRLNGAALAAETGSACARNNVQSGDAGSYSVVVSNVAGTVTSSNALLSLEPAAAPHIDSIASRPDGGVELQISGGPGNFAIECAPAPSGWTQLESLTSSNAVFHYLDPDTNQASRYYRVRVLP